jgi:hypothetical protein
MGFPTEGGVLEKAETANSRVEVLKIYFKKTKFYVILHYKTIILKSFYYPIII